MGRMFIPLAWSFDDERWWGLFGLVFVEPFSLPFFRYREACCSENTNDDCHPFREPVRRLRHNSYVIGVQNTLDSPSHARQRFVLRCSDYSCIKELDQIPYEGFVWAEAY